MGLFNENNLKSAELVEPEIEKRTILIVDDEYYNLKTLEDALVDDYNVLTAKDGQEALEFLQNHPDPNRIHLIISDQRMPNMTGVEFLQKSIEIVPKTIRIILTGYTDVDAIMDSINQARIFKFILKPFDRQDLLLTIRRGLDQYDLEESNHVLIKALEFLNGNLFNHVRGILQGMSGAMELMSEEGMEHLSLRQKSMLAALSSNTQNLNSVVNKASELSFIYTRDKSLRPESINMIALMGKIRADFLEDKAAGDVTIKNSWLPEEKFEDVEEYYIEVDRELFIVSIRELLENAFNYAEKPTTISIMSKTQEDQLVIHIVDQGIGLQNEGGQSLLMPFVRGPKSHKYQPDGMGVGLAKVKANVELMGGRLLMKQTAAGSVVSLVLPLMQADGEFDEADASIELASKKVLLFQEKKEDLQLYREILNFEGHEVICFHEPDDLINAISLEQPDIILLDAYYNKLLTLPYIENIRERSQTESIPIVVLANDPKLNNQQLFMDYGVQAYASRSIEYDRLTMLINQL